MASSFGSLLFKQSVQLVACSWFFSLFSELFREANDALLLWLLLVVVLLLLLLSLRTSSVSKKINALRAKGVPARKACGIR